MESDTRTQNLDLWNLFFYPGTNSAFGLFPATRDTCLTRPRIRTTSHVEQIILQKHILEHENMRTAIEWQEKGFALKKTWRDWSGQQIGFWLLCLRWPRFFSKRIFPVFNVFLNAWITDDSSNKTDPSVLRTGISLQRNIQFRLPALKHGGRKPDNPTCAITS